MCCTQGPITSALKFWDAAAIVGNIVGEPAAHRVRIDGIDHAFRFGNGRLPCSHPGV